MAHSCVPETTSHIKLAQQAAEILVAILFMSVPDLGKRHEQAFFGQCQGEVIPMKSKLGSQRTCFSNLMDMVPPRCHNSQTPPEVRAQREVFHRRL